MSPKVQKRGFSGPQTALMSSIIFTARKRSLQRLCFYTCLSVILFTGVCVWLLGGCMVAGGHAWLWVCVHDWGGMHGCQGVCVVVATGCAWVWGGVHGCWGHAWLLGGHAWLWGGAACVVAGGACVGYKIRSMSGRYASYWNAFLFFKKFTQ